MSAAPQNVALDSNGYAYITYEDGSSGCNSGGSNCLKVAKSSTPGGVFTMASGYPKLLDATTPFNNSFESVVALTSGKVVVFGCPQADKGFPLEAYSYSGSAWSAKATTTNSCYRYGLSVTASSDTAYAAFGDWTHSYVATYAYSAGAFSNEAESTADSGFYSSVACLSTCSTIFIAGFSPVYHASYIMDLGGVFTPLITVDWNSYNFQPLISVDSADNLLLMLYSTGITPPYNVEFASLPAVDPDAVTSPNSWSKPGLSPYEVYFQHLTETISPGNGLLGVEQDDLAVPGRGIDLVLGRVFSSPKLFRGSSPFIYDNYTLAPMGYGWSLNLPWLGSYFLHLTDGQEYQYQWSGNTFAYHNATDFVLTHNSDGSYTLSMPSGMQYQFGSNESLLSVVDATGNNAISFRYSGGHIFEVIDTIGRAATFSYNSAGQLASINYNGEAWTYSYSGGDLVSATDPLGRTTSYQYGGPNPWLVSAVFYPSGGWSQYTYGNAQVGSDTKTYYVTLRNVYSSAGTSSLARSDSVSYDIVNGQVIWSNSTVSDGTTVQGHTNSNFQGAKRMMRVYDENSAESVVKMTEQDYDASGRTNETKLLSPSGALLTYSASSYDDWGNVVHSRDNVGKETWSSYANTDSLNTFGTTGFSNSFYVQTISSNIHDALVGQATWQDGTGSMPQETYFKYNSAGNLLEQKQLHNGSWLLTDYTYNQYGNQITVTDALGRTTYFHYSSTFQHAYLTLTSAVVNGQNVTTSSTYDPAMGWLLSQTNANGFTTSYSYDGLGRLIQTTYPAVNGVRATTTNGYDDKNNILTTMDADGNVAKEYFDGLGRMTSLVRYNGTLVYSTESYTYNWLDSVATKTTATGSVYTYTYDQDGQLIKTLNPDSTSTTVSYDDVSNIKTVTDENGHQTAYGYDWNGNLIWVRQYYTTSGYYQTSYVYDFSGNLLSVTDAKNQVTSYQYDDLNRLVKTTLPDGTYTVKAYDAVGNLVSSTDPAGKTTTYSYDTLYRLANLTYPDSSTVAYTYDNNRNKISENSQAGSFHYTYDARGRLTNETDILSGARYTTLYTYDSAGNVLSATYPDGTVVSYSYDALNRVTKLGTFATFTYNPDDSIKTIAYGNGVSTAYTYDSRGRPTRILSNSGTTRLLDLNYSYDGIGNALKIDTETYSYDWLNRLVASSGPWGATAYGYDSVGNIINETKNSVVTTYTYGAYNRLIQEGNAAISYNANGDTTKVVNGSTTWQYGYDYADRLVNATKNSVLAQTNSYESNGNRVEQTHGSSTVVYAYEGINAIFEKNLTSGAVTDYFYANGLQLTKVVAGTTAYYQIDDALGSVRLVTLSNAATFFSSNYQPYGAGYSQTSSEEFAYTGKMMDALTGLYYFGARFYDDAAERFMTEDSSTGGRDDPMSLNGYIYARDNPMAITDQTGHDWWSTLTNAVSNSVATVTAAVSTAATDATNAWNSLPPVAKIAVVAGVSAVAIVATLGAAAPEVAALDVGAVGAIDLGAAASTVGAAASAAATLATPEEEAGFAAFEQQVIAQGPKAVGDYGEEVAKGYLQNLGLEVSEQVPFRGAAGNRVADIVVKQLASIKNLAVEVKTSGPWGYGGSETNQLSKGQISDYLYAAARGRFGGVLYTNVPIGEGSGFSAGAQAALKFLGIAYKALHQ